MTPSQNKDYSRKGNANWNGYLIKTDSIIFGIGLRESFFDCYEEELLTCTDILNSITFSDRQKETITVTFDKNFLRKIVKSHIHFVKELDAH